MTRWTPLSMARILLTIEKQPEYPSEIKQNHHGGLRGYL
jgi:hypothetical protein